MTAPKITMQTGAALRKVFQLLEDQFDGENGCYKNGYSDEKIAKETGISTDAVKGYRVNAFGKIKPPTELQMIRMDLNELETFALKTENDIKAKAKELSMRLSAIERKFD